jgi:phage/plasmid primase-like uncharacterized protein
MIHARDLAKRFDLRAVGTRLEWRGKCPSCSYPSSLILKQKHGKVSFRCVSCDDWQALANIMLGAGGGGRSARVDACAEQREATAAQKSVRAVALWRGSAPCPGSLAETYLMARALAGLAISSALRFRPDTPHPAGRSLPALLALVQGVDGEPQGIHRTYLRRDGGGKAEVEPQKASLGPVAGGAIRLHLVGSELVVGEGIETAASAGLMLGLPAWSAVSAGNMARTLALPPEVRAVVIAADADPPGQRAAATAAARWMAEGRRVRIATPDRAGFDFNDVLREVRRG